jgi:phosphatidylserine decarboxylase
MSNLSLGERVVRSAWRMTPQRALSEVIGWGARRSLPGPVKGPVLRSFVDRFGIDMSEAEKPLDAYGGVQEVFTRRLRPGVRPVAADPDAVVSPADGTVVEVGVIAAGGSLDAKGRGFALPDLLADAELAAALEGGAYQIVYLSPRDYHRVHSPVGGRIVGWRHVPGCLFPVNDRSVAREPGLFARNERFVSVIDGDAGLCAVVMVAAVGVGHITAAYDPEVATHAGGFESGEVRRRLFDEPVPIARGDELGTFNLGSTSIVIFSPGRVTLDPASAGASSRMGAAVGRLSSGTPTQQGGRV